MAEKTLDGFTKLSVPVFSISSYNDIIGGGIGQWVEALEPAVGSSNPYCLSRARIVETTWNVCGWCDFTLATRVAFGKLLDPNLAL